MFSFTQEQMTKIFKGAAIAGAGAAGIYGLEALASLNFGIWTPAAVAVLSILINIVKVKFAVKK
jgi:hypothetical protein